MDYFKTFRKEEYEANPEVTARNEDYMHIQDVLDSAVKRLRLRQIEPIFARTVRDCCRVHAVLGKHDDVLYEDVLELKSTRGRYTTKSKKARSKRSIAKY